MMDLTIDARGDACPLPVVKAKQALSQVDEGTVTVLVDNETAVENLGNLAKSLKAASEHERTPEGDFAVRIMKDGSSNLSDVSTESAGGTAKAGPRVVVLPASTMGTGDDTLGAALMKAFVFALTQQDVLPDTVLCYNGGVHLTCEGSESLDDLRALAAAGVEVLSCGTCLNHFGITDKLAVGEVTNMYVIAEKQLTAGVIVRP